MIGVPDLILGGESGRGSLALTHARRERKLGYGLPAQDGVEDFGREVGYLQRELASERGARLAAEQELARLRGVHKELQEVLVELRELALRLRTITVEQQADVVELGAPHDSPGKTPRSGTVFYVPPVAAAGRASGDWLAGAIRRMADRGNARLAAELVLELLPYQAQLVSGAVRYVVVLDELGGFEVSLSDGCAAIRAVKQSDWSIGSAADFSLEGPARAFAEFAAGGTRGRDLRLPRGLRLPRKDRTRRAARRLFAASQKPVTLAELVRARVWVWPGLLLFALSEAIGPIWADPPAFTIAFAIDGTVLHISAQHGSSLRVTGADARDASLRGELVATVKLSERAFMCMLSAMPLPDGEQILLEGDATALERLLAWTDEAQGIRRFIAPHGLSRMRHAPQRRRSAAAMDT